MNRMACNLVMRRVCAIAVGRSSAFTMNNSQATAPRVSLSLTAHTMYRKGESWEERYERKVEEGRTRQQRLEIEMRKMFEKEVDERNGVHRQSLGQIFDPYDPHVTGIKESTQKQLRKLYARHTIKTEDRSKEKFDKNTIARQAQKKYIDMNNELQKKPLTKASDSRLLEWATVSMVEKLKDYFTDPRHCPYWRFDKEVAPPKVVHLAVTKDDSENMIAQVTVQMNTLQIRAMRDQFGRVIQGCLKTPQPVTNYIVVEKYLPDPYGRWKICGQVRNQ